MLVILKEKYHGNFDVFGQSHFTIPLLIYKVILKHQESEINQFLKAGQIMGCSSPFGDENVVT